MAKHVHVVHVGTLLSTTTSLCPLPHSTTICMCGSQGCTDVIWLLSGSFKALVFCSCSEFNQIIYCSFHSYMMKTRCTRLHMHSKSQFITLAVCGTNGLEFLAPLMYTILHVYVYTYVSMVGIKWGLFFLFLFSSLLTSML